MVKLSKNFKLTKNFTKGWTLFIPSMGNQRLPRWLFIRLLVGILLVGLLSLGVFGFEYYTANKLFNHGEALLNTQKYEEAIEKLTLAQSHWIPNSFKHKLRLALQEATELESSQEAYKRGQKLFDDGKWLEAIKALNEVNKINPNYEKAQSLLLEAREKALAQILSELKSGQQKEAVRQEKSSAIESIDRQIDGLLLLQQEQIKTGRVFLEGFYICEEMQDQNLELSCKEQALRDSNETRAEIDKTQERIDNLELQKAILQSGL